MPGKNRKAAPSSSQLMDLLFHVCAELGIDSDQQLAEVADVTRENVANWRDGLVKEFKLGTLETVKRGLSTRLKALKAAAGQRASVDGHTEVEVEEGSSPADLQRQFQELVGYDYIGHRFLYYEPQGALAWEKLIGAGYDQDRWLAGAEKCVEAWLDTKKDEHGHAVGALAGALGFDGRGRLKGFELVALGSGEAAKELLLFNRVMKLEKGVGRALPFLTFAPVDVSIPLLIRAAFQARKLALANRVAPPYSTSITAFCADFEEGRLSFARRLAGGDPAVERGARLVSLLGNTFGNLRDEDRFLRERLHTLVRPGDFLWLEVGVRAQTIEDEPLFMLTLDGHAETAGEANRRLLLEGPYRRWEAALGRPTAEVAMRVRVRQNDETSRVPGSINFCHDLVFRTDRRVCTMLYSRRYDIPQLTQWLERHGFKAEGIATVEDSGQKPRVAHLLLRRTGA